jgi:glutamate racemase
LDKEKAIGIFDSGIGGLTVLREIIAALPGENTIYLGDTARLPYGTKSPTTIFKYALQNANFLLTKDIKLLIVACNSASSTSLPQLQEAISIPTVGVIEPGVRAAIACSRNGRIGVIGTETTINSGAYQRVLSSLNASIHCFTQICPLFVPLVEEGWESDEITHLVASRYLTPLREERIDTLILGCTHYPRLKGAIGKAMGNGVTLIDSARETALEIMRIMEKAGGLKSPEAIPQRHYYVTDQPDKFIRIGNRFLPVEPGQVSQIDL